MRCEISKTRNTKKCIDGIRIANLKKLWQCIKNHRIIGKSIHLWVFCRFWKYLSWYTLISSPWSVIMKGMKLLTWSISLLSNLFQRLVSSTVFWILIDGVVVFFLQNKSHTLAISARFTGFNWVDKKARLKSISWPGKHPIPSLGVDAREFFFSDFWFNTWTWCIFSKSLADTDLKIPAFTGR